MRLLMLAPPGSGKGTQAKRLVARYGIEHIASGELLRHEVDAGSDIGLEARAYLEQGDLVPDEVVLSMIGERVVAAAAGAGYVLDGYPRNVGQAREAHRLAAEIGDVDLQAVIYLDVPRAELRRRMLTRAGSEGRTDDTRVTIDHRLEVFDAQTQPLLAFYDESKILLTVPGDQHPDQVEQAIVTQLEERGLTPRPTGDD